MPESSEISEELPVDDAAADCQRSLGVAHKEAPADRAADHEEEEETPVLDVHPAHHAANSWREFFVHIATIVLGLLIAVGLEQVVESIHHHRELAEVREDLRGERQANRNSFAVETSNWRWEAAELENNLMVLSYLQVHPGTADEKLPGALVWSHASAPSTQAVWDAAKTSSVTSLMPRQEVEQYEDTYNQLKKVDDARSLAYEAMTDASRYEFTGSRLPQLNPTQIDEILSLTRIALTRHWMEGVALENTARKFSDFPRSVSSVELSAVRNRKSMAEMMQLPSFALTISRMKAAGYVP